MTRLHHLRPHLFTSHRDGIKRYFASHDMPYPVDCAVLGHKPVWVDLPSINSGYHECARCTLRPTVTAQALTWTSPDRRTETRAFIERALAEGEVYWQPRRADSHLEVSSRYTDQLDLKLKIGNAGSETPLDAHLIIPGWRGFYFGTSVLGNRIAHWRSRRAEPGKQYKSKVYGFCVDKDRVRWQFGGTEGEWSKGTPKWRDGSWSWRDALFGKTVYEKVDGDPIEVLIPMPEGDYPATANTYRQTWTRPRFAKPRTQTGIDFRVEGGVPNGREKYGDWDSTWGFAISAENLNGWQTWAPEAAAESLMKDRERYTTTPHWKPPADARNPRMLERPA